MNAEKKINSLSSRLYQQLKDNGINFFVSVPCKFLAELISLMENDPDIIYTPVTREEEGIGLMAGACLGGKRPAMVMQNSGLGNSVNAIASLSGYYQLPFLLIISHRGTEGERIDAQYPMGKITSDILNTVNIPFYIFSSGQDLRQMDPAIRTSYQKQKPAAFLFPISFWKQDIK